MSPRLGILLLLIAAGPANGAVIVKPKSEAKGFAVSLEVQGDSEENGQAVLRLSSYLRVTLVVEGPEAPKGDVRLFDDSAEWKNRKDKQTPPKSIPLPNGRLRWEQAFVLEPEKPGDFSLQLKPISLGDNSVQWEPFSVRVTTTAKADISDLRDITGLEYLPDDDDVASRWLIWGGIGLVGCGVAVGLWELRRRRRVGEEELPPHEWINRELRRIESLNLPAAGETAKYHTLLADAIRRYLELRFSLRATHQTTVEFLGSLRDSPLLTDEQQNLLRSFLESSDLAKFAQVTPSVDQCRESFQAAQRIVQETALAEANRT